MDWSRRHKTHRGKKRIKRKKQIFKGFSISIIFLFLVYRFSLQHNISFMQLNQISHIKSIVIVSLALLFILFIVSLVPFPFLSFITPGLPHPLSSPVCQFAQSAVSFLFHMFRFSLSLSWFLLRPLSVFTLLTDLFPLWVSPYNTRSNDRSYCT